MTMSASPPLYRAEAVVRGVGAFTVTLIAVDGFGNVALAGANVTLVDTQPPVASGGGDREVWLGSSVVFDASASSDNSAIVNVSWSFTYNGTPVVRFGSVASFVFDAVGEVTVTLRIVDAGGLEGTSTFLVRIVTDTPPPQAPADATTVPAGPSCLSIAWSPSLAPDLAGYRVSRWNATAYRFDPAATLPANATSYVDCGLAADTVYSYWIEAFDSNGNLSPPSGISGGRTASALVGSEDLTPLYQTLVALALILVVGLVAWKAGARRGKGPRPPE